MANVGRLTSAGVPHIHIAIALDKLSTQTSEHPQASQCLSSGEDPKHYKQIQGVDESMAGTNVGGYVVLNRDRIFNKRPQ